MEMDDDMIKRESGQYDLELVQRLYLQNQFIKVISNTMNLINLVDLSLSRNEIVTINGLSTLTLLKRLDLSYNKISLVQNLETLVQLQWLDIGYNRIESLVDAMEHLSELPKLTSLKLGESINDKNDQIVMHGGAIAPNPCITSKKYPLLAFEYLPNLTVLDGSLVSVLRDVALESALMINSDKSSDKDSSLLSKEDITAAESWLSLDDNDNTKSGRNQHHITDVATDVTNTYNNVKKSIQEDGSHLLRKAEKLLLNEKL